MLIPIVDLKKLIETEDTDFKLEMRLKAIEQSIRAYTNNNFIQRSTLQSVTVQAGVLITEKDLFKVGDTVELFHTQYSDGLYIIKERLSVGSYRVTTDVDDGEGRIARVVYPYDVIMGAVDMLQYDIDNEGREGIASESISRHSVSYVTGTEGNTSSLGYPIRLTKFLNPYRRMKR